jgi:glycosyltransferase involved in cell wall biosynthesis
VEHLRFVIVHSHYRPGGVRRVIELALPGVAAALRPRVTDIVLVGGEPPDDAWLARLRRSTGVIPVSCAIDPALGYVSEQRARPERIGRRIRALIERVLFSAPPGGAVVWAHNIGLGRNLPLADTLQAVCVARRVPLVLHHHDWWFDNRWARWPEMRRSGFRSLAAVAGAILPVAPGVKHAAINHADTSVLAGHFGSFAGWLPNPAAPAARPPAARVRDARRWLRETLGDDGPVWIVPCRLLRRKNLAEALLLTRWLRPEAWLVTTGGVSSADEHAYAATLGQAARRHDWRLRLGVLAGSEVGKPAVDALLGASEAVLLTSLQEGFGLPNLEAAAAGRPLLARTLRNIAPDLARFGFRFPQAYDDVQIDPALFDWRAERERQRERWRAWRAGLPAHCRALAGRPALLATRAAPATVPFSRLTLTAQLEVLARPAAESWAQGARHNPWLAAWRERAATGGLRPSDWPAGATRRLDGAAYARRFRRLLRVPPSAVPAPEAGVQAMDQFIRDKLTGDNQYPLLWSVRP